MNLFLVALDDDASPDAVNALVLKHYKDTSYRLSSATWVVADHASVSTAEVGRKLSIEQQSSQNERQSGLVALISDYSGYADKSLWQLMRQWSAQ